MAHHTLKTAYSGLADRLNRSPQGAPPSESLYKILKVLFSEKEARLVSLLPIGPFTAKRASRIWKMNIDDTQNILDKLSDRALLVDIDYKGKYFYVLPPPMAGFFEFSMMRVRGDIDQKLLSELFYQYLNIEEDFVRQLFATGETQLGRTFVHEPALSDENALYVLDYERATEVIKSSTCMGVGDCYCRHKMKHVGKACDAPMNICMTFNNTAASLVRHGHARKVDVVEGLDLLRLAYEKNLVQFGENVREGVNFICNCCGCCCEAMLAARRFAVWNPIHTTNFLPVVKPEGCNGCGRCVNVCPVEAMVLVSANNPVYPKLRVAKLNEDICLGCGLCVRACNRDSLHLSAREKRVITPRNTLERTLWMAIERGKLQNFIFDNRVLFSHRALAYVLGIILKLPPMNLDIVKTQMKSRYVDNIISRKRFV